MIETLLILSTILGLMVALPFIIYLSAKLGAYGWLRGTQLFEEHTNAVKKEESTTNVRRTPKG